MRFIISNDNIPNLSLKSVQRPTAWGSTNSSHNHFHFCEEYLDVAQTHIHTHMCKYLQYYEYIHQLMSLNVHAIVTMRSCQNKHWYMVCIWLNTKKKAITEKFSNVHGPLGYENGGIFSLLMQFIFGIEMSHTMSYALAFPISHNSKFYKLFIAFVSICNTAVQPYTVRSTAYSHEIIQLYLYLYMTFYIYGIMASTFSAIVSPHFQNFRNYTHVETFVRINCKWLWKM